MYVHCRRVCLYVMCIHVHVHVHIYMYMYMYMYITVSGFVVQEEAEGTGGRRGRESQEAEGLETRLGGQ